MDFRTITFVSQVFIIGNVTAAPLTPDAAAYEVGEFLAEFSIFFPAPIHFFHSPLKRNARNAVVFTINKRK